MIKEKELHIGKLIKRKIRESGQKQKCLAKKMSLSESKISRICQNKTIITNILIRVCIHLDYNFFNNYTKFIDGFISKEKDILLTQIYKFITTEKIHVGKLIKKIKTERKLISKILAEKIGYTEKNIYKLYKRENIDTGRLILISKHLNFNFFDIYTEFVDEQIQKQKSIL